MDSSPGKKAMALDRSDLSMCVDWLVVVRGDSAISFLKIQVYSALKAL